MKYLKPLLGLPVVVFFVALSGTTMTSCTKSNTDTIYVPHDSAVYVHDTTSRTDTTYSLMSGLVAYYNFNGGNLNDSSGYNNNIVFNNAIPTTDRNGVPNNAYLFDGSTSYMEVANSPSLNPENITLYAIFKVNGFYAGEDHGNFILQKDWDQADGQYILQYTDFVNPTGLPDTLHEIFDAGYGNDNNTPNTAGVKSTNIYVTTGTWYRLAYTYDGMVANLYLNGNLIGTTSKLSVPFSPNTADLHIGRNEDPSGLFPFWFNGVIDEIRIYNRALTSKEIGSLVHLP